MRIHFGEFPPDLMSPVKVEVERWARCLPSWCEVLVATFDADDTENHATMDARYMHRESRLRIAPQYFSLDAGSRSDTIIHEFGHVLAAPVDDVVADIILDLPRALVARHERLYERAMEALVTDFGHAIKRVSPS